MSALNQLLEASFTARLCVALLHSLWQIGLLAIALWVIERFAGQRSVNGRYKMHVAALLLALVTVPLTFLALDVPQEHLAPTAVGSSAAETELAAQSFAPATSPAESQGHGQRAAEASSPPAIARPMPVPSTSVLPVVSITRWIAGIYALGVLLMLARLLRGMWLGQRMISRAQALTDGPLVLATRRIAERWKLAALPRLAISDALSMPCVTGLLRPTIVFPLAALSGMSPTELELILAHELAHVRRHDLWIHLLQRLAEVVLFFNPGLWYLSRRLSVLREYCCDELACGVPASSTDSTRLQYAAALVHSAELQLARRVKFSGSSLAEIGALAATGSSPSELRRRVARILHEPVRDPVLLTRAQVVVFVVLIAALAIAPAAVYSGNQDPNGLDKQPTGSLEKQQAAEPEVPAAQPDPFTRTLANGAKVKVLSIGTFNDSPDHWWHPDGSPFEGVPYQVMDNERYRFPGPVTREVVFAVENVPEDATVRIDTSPPSTNWGNGGVADADGNRVAHHHGRIFTLARDVQTFELKVSVAVGKWETVAACEPRVPAQSPVAANGVIFSGPFRQDAGRRREIVTVSHELQDPDTRLVVVDKQGKSHPALNWYRESSGKNVKVSQYDIPVPIELIARLEFQARDYEWASFDKLPVEPKPDKNAKATISGRIRLADGSAPTEKGLIYSQWRGIDGNAEMRTEGLVDDSTDRFSLQFKPGTVWLSYFVKGFAPAWIGPVELNPGQRAENIDVVLREGFSVDLQVVDETGQPVPQPGVVAFPTFGGDSAGPSVAENGDAQGKVVLAHVANTPYRFIVYAKGHQTLSIRERVLHAGEIVRLTMKKSKPATGVLLLSTGAPAAGAVLQLRVKAQPGSYSTYDSHIMATADDEGRFAIDELTDGEWYLFLAETTDGAKAMLPAIQSGQTDLRVEIPPRRDLRVRLVGDLAKLPVRDGKPFIGIRQRYEFRPAPDASYGDLVGGDAFVTPTGDGGIAEFKGLIPGDVAITTKGRKPKDFKLNGDQQELTIPVEDLP